MPATYDARRFGGALAHHLHRITNLDHAWTTGLDLWLAGLDPDHPATLAGDCSESPHPPEVIRRSSLPCWPAPWPVEGWQCRVS